ncbi:helix-turn-helix domain-containing protein [Agrobacterium larrymoorei]|uniref:Helix-turn-helix transcriptional regulator n=3 Tax=Agrobacterium larrymoorei TaxID=160699 RepID=A0A4D7DR39_9HYPH|nr:helix-turn-helix transcriptional regulator [Agrobacterium larrymoorei]QCI98838.1 XRE family transcriptional regulator [Agrobacterium larrymoorei]QYA08274.1 helix-turn-helix transcriptional regulator [Agrobacterium larrymoorei]
MEHRERIGRNLRTVRVAQRMTQEDLAGLARVDRTTISGIERGDFNASVDLLARLADGLSADISAFFAIPESDERPEPLKAGRKPGR